MVDEALGRLLAGDPRFVAGRRAYPDQTPAHHRELAAGQHTFAAILGWRIRVSRLRLPFAFRREADITVLTVGMKITGAKACGASHTISKPVAAWSRSDKLARS